MERLTLVFASGTMANAVSEGTIANYNAEKGTKGWSPADVVVIPTFQAVLKVIRLAKDFSPDRFSQHGPQHNLGATGPGLRSDCACC